jgi:sialidase-1
VLHRQTLFEARQRGYHSYRIPGVAVTSRGEILVSVEGRRENQSDLASTDILLRRSGDRGQTWTPPRVVVDQSGFGPGPCSNFVMIPLPSGEVRALVCHDYLQVFTMVSPDAGDHFIDVEDITRVFEGFRDQYP